LPPAQDNRQTQKFRYAAPLADFTPAAAFPPLLSPRLYAWRMRRIQPRVFHATVAQPTTPAEHAAMFSRRATGSHARHRRH